MDYNPKILADNVNALLEKHGLSYRELAARLGVSHSTIGAWVTGRAVPRMDKIDAMCKMFNVSRSYFCEDHNVTDSALQELIDLCNSRPGLAGQILALLQVQSQSDRDDPSDKR